MELKEKDVVVGVFGGIELLFITASFSIVKTATLQDMDVRSSCNSAFQAGPKTLTRLICPEVSE